MAVKKSMRIFGVPHQFSDAVDPRISNISPEIGNNFMKNILNDAPICTIIPGEPKYLPNVSSATSTNDDSDNDARATVTSALASSFITESEGFKSISNLLSQNTDEDLRLYDFKRNYTEYMKYVNCLCRAGAIMLDLNTSLDGTSFSQYDWKNYRQDGKNYYQVSSSTSRATKGLLQYIQTGVSEIKKVIGVNDFLYEAESSDDSEDGYSSDDIEDALSSKNYVQFFVDPDSGASETMSNSSSDSMIKSAFDSSQNFMKELAFLSNSGGLGDIADSLEGFTTGTLDAIGQTISSFSSNNDSAFGQLGTALSRVINLSSNVLKGENMILPQIYQSSEYSKTYSLTVHLRSPYGTKLSYYMNIFVPLMHLIALGLPRQSTANTYSSPFLVKAYIDGVFSCNMGMVSNIEISRAGDSWSAEGLPSEVDVTLSITDLYAALTMSSTANPSLFVNNSSLIEYLATNCGLSLIGPSIKTKLNLVLSSYKNSITDIPSNISAAASEYIDNELIKFTSLMGG